MAQISISLGGVCPTVPTVHLGSVELSLLSHKGLVSSLASAFTPGSHHKINGKSGTDAAED